jgi:hypothetical protein
MRGNGSEEGKGPGYVGGGGGWQPFWCIEFFSCTITIRMAGGKFSCVNTMDSRFITLENVCFREIRDRHRKITMSLVFLRPCVF